MGWEEQYEVVAELRANGRVPVTKYRSRRTGLTVTLAQVSGPSCHIGVFKPFDLMI